MRVRFEVAVSAEELESHWTAHGWDVVEYRIATNPGEPLKPLHEIASGGEMSRVMLALKVAVEEASSKSRKRAPRLAPWSSMRSTSASVAAAAEAVGQKLKPRPRPAGPLRHPPAPDRRLR